MSARRGRINFVGIAITAVIAAALGGAALFGPYYWDYLVVKEITRTVALTWEATGLHHKAEMKLDEEATNRELPDYIDYKSACTLAESGRMKVVNCAWVAHVYYPFTDYYKTLDFNVTSEVDGSGQVHTR